MDQRGERHGRGLFLDPAVHEQLLTHLPHIWTAPVLDVAQHLQQTVAPQAT